MKHFVIIGLLVIACCALQASAQGTFQNLGFESANLSPVPPGQFGGSVPSSNAIPGWTAFLGTNQVNQVLQNNLTLGNASVDILGPNWSFGGIIEGNYTLVLQPGAGGGPGVNISASISQTGLIPSNALSFQIKASAATSFTVNLAGQDLALVPLSAVPNYSLYGADITQFSGQIGKLTVTALAAPNTTDYFDSIVFSPQPIPEPGCWQLLIGASLVRLLKKWAFR